VSDLEARLHDALDPLVAEGYLPGYVAVARTGSERATAFGGVRDLEAGLPMRADAIVRIASLSKPIGAALALTLVEDGLFGLDDPVDTWLPEFAGLPVLRMPTAALGDVVPLARPMTIRHLLTMTSGLGWPAADSPMEHALAAKDPDGASSADEFVELLASLPLQFQPGDGWRYHTSAGVLSVLLERAAGRELGVLVEDRVRAPLGLDHLDFYCKDPDRRALAYTPSGTGRLEPMALNTLLEPRPFRSVAGLLHSTAADLVTFLDDLCSTAPRVLSAAGATALRTPRLTSEQRADAAEFLDPGGSYGFLVGVAESAGRHGGVGRFGWSGSTGVEAAADPGNDTTGAVFIFRETAAPADEPAFDRFWDAVYDVNRA
jgi:CubicO group peptidase (beta-lactamase class C family)